MIAEKWDISREDMEAFAVQSHERAITARAEGRFDNEIVALRRVTQDEGPREPNLGEDPLAEDPDRGRPHHRRGRLADLRRRRPRC